MKEKVSLSYACPIPWEEMKAINDKDRFCSKCQKKVRDFTKDNIPDTEGVECGKFYLDQLSNISRTFSIGKQQVLAISLFSLLGLAPSPVYSQVDSSNSTSAASQVETPASFHLSGVVRHGGSGHTISSATVVARYTNGTVLEEVITNFNGRFWFDLPAERLSRGDIIIEVSLPGFHTTKKNLEVPAEKKLVEISLKPVVHREPLPRINRTEVRGMISPEKY